MPGVIQYVPPLGTPTYRTGQSFTVQRSGWLTRVEVYLQSCRSTPPDVVVEIRRGTSFSGPLVASGTISGGSIPPREGGGCGIAATPAYFVSADVSAANLQVQSGEAYSIWPFVTGGEAYILAGSAGYSEGAFLERSNTGETIPNPAIDVGFKTFVISPSN